MLCQCHAPSVDAVFASLRQHAVCNLAVCLSPSDLGVERVREDVLPPSFLLLLGWCSCFFVWHRLRRALPLDQSKSGRSE